MMTTKKTTTHNDEDEDADDDANLGFLLWMFFSPEFGSLGVSAGLHELTATPETSLTLKR